MRFLFWLCAALVMGSSTLSTRLWRELRAEREQTTSLQSQIDAAAVRERVLAQTPVPAAPAPAPTTAVADAPTPAPAATPRPAPVDPRTTDFAAQQRELWKDPEYRKARLAQARLQAARNYPGLAEDLGLSAAEESRLLDVLAEYDVDMNATITSVTTGSNDPATSQQVSARLTEIQRQREDAVAAVLGPNGSTRWQQFQETSAARSQANSYNTMLTQAGQPLSATQLKSLATTVATEQKRQRDEMTALTRNINTQDPAAIAAIQTELRKRQDDYNERVLAAAAPIVSAQQLEMLRAQFTQQSAMRRAIERHRSTVTAGGAVNSRTLTTVAASLVLICGMVTTNLWRELRSQREATAALRAGLAESRERIKAAEERIATATAAAAGAAAAARVVASTPAPEQKPATPPAPPTSGTVVFTSASGAASIRISEQDLMKDPEYRKARLTMMRTTIRQNYPGLAEELGLNADQADQLFELLAQNQMEQSTQLTSVLGAGGQVDQVAMAEVNRNRQAMQRELNDSLQKMLGAAGYSQWQDYQRTQGQRVQANSYATQLAQAGVPMSASQNKALVDMLIAEQRNLQMDTVQLGRLVDPSNPETRAEAQKALSDRRARSNQQFLDAAAGTLTPQQINVLREQFAQQEAINRAQERVRERTQGAQGGVAF